MKIWVCAATMAVACTIVGAPATADAPIVDADPATLERGPDLAVPHLEGSTYVDGEVEVALGSRVAELLGESGDDQVVVVYGKGTKVLRVDTAGRTTTVLRTRRRAASTHLSTDGRKIVVTGVTSGAAQPRTVYSATTGRRLARRTFAHYPTTLAMKGSQVYYTIWERGTFVWNARTDKVRRVTRRPAEALDLEHDLLASYTGDPYEGGCMTLTRLSDPSDRVWLSCSERVMEFSPDGSRIATVDLLSDGLGPGQLALRTVAGTELARYRTGGWFGTISWEDGDTLALESNGKKESAWVRCDLDECENASDTRPTVAPRLSLVQRAGLP